MVAVVVSEAVHAVFVFRPFFSTDRGIATSCRPLPGSTTRWDPIPGRGVTVPDDVVAGLATLVSMWY